MIDWLERPRRVRIMVPGQARNLRSVPAGACDISDHCVGDVRSAGVLPRDEDCLGTLPFAAIDQGCRLGKSNGMEPHRVK